MGMISEFKAFAMKGNVMDLAVGVIIGGAFGRIVDSMVGDVIMPVISAILGGKLDFSSFLVPLGTVPEGTIRTTPETVSSDQKARNFVAVMQRMEPAVVQQCLSRRRGPISCDFQFVVDDREGMEPNAFQTVDSAGRPIIGFTVSLFIAAVAFPGSTMLGDILVQDAAKMGALFSFAAAIVSVIAGRLTRVEKQHG